MRQLDGGKLGQAAGATELDSRWASVVARDCSADGTFYYSVATTGVYCRPSCPSRLANPKNVRFHTSHGDAEAAGFRPCRRCRPDQASADALKVDRIAGVCALIERSDEHLSLAALAHAAGLSRYYFHRLFRATTGVTPKAYAEACRAGKLRDELGRRGTVTEAIYSAGFNSNSRFYAQSEQLLGMTPTEFRADGTDVLIRMAVGECSLGSILVAMSDVGVCAILLGDDPDKLIEELQRRFSQAHLVAGDAKFDALIAQVVGFVEAPQIGFDLPLDIRGTAFQRRVWQALRQIPPGTTATYAEIAVKIDAPRATRAVAGACAANALAVAIPCHRVIRSDGALSGYRWGIERKRALIDREREQ